MVWFITAAICVAGTSDLFHPSRPIRHGTIIGSVVRITLSVFLGVSGTGLALFLCCYFHDRNEKIKRRQKLFCHGIPAMATVTFVGMTHNPTTKSCCRIVRWSYIAEGMESVGVTPREELPDAVVNDRFWVLYEKEYPWFVRRWALFDDDGNLRSNDELPWSPKLDTLFLE